MKSEMAYPHEINGAWLPEISELLRAIPGIKTLTALVAINPHLLDMSERIDYLSALERQTGWLQALMQRAIVLAYTRNNK